MANNQWSDRIRRGLSELTIIVVGVLIALWAEAWRGDRADLRQMSVYLDQLAAEIDETQARLSESIAQDSTSRERAQELSRLLREGLGGLAPDSAQALYNLNYSTYVPTLPTLDLLVSTSDVRLVKSPVLRTQMRGVAAELERTAPALQSTMDRLNEVYGQLLLEGERLWWKSGRRDTAEEGSLSTLLREDFGLTRETPEVSALVLQQASSLNIRTNRKRAVRSELDALAALLAQESRD